MVFAIFHLGLIENATIEHLEKIQKAGSKIVLFTTEPFTAVQDLKATGILHVVFQDLTNYGHDQLTTEFPKTTGTYAQRFSTAFKAVCEYNGWEGKYHFVAAPCRSTEISRSMLGCLPGSSNVFALNGLNSGWVSEVAELMAEMVGDDE